MTRRLLERIRVELPDVAVRTTLIAGFPGETESEFVELLDFVRDFGFDHLGVFAYSPEEGTDAGRLPEQIPFRERRRRRRALLEAQKESARRRNQRLVGRRLGFLVEGEGKGTRWIGRHGGQAPEIDGISHLRPIPGFALTAGEFCTGIVTSAGSYDLAARVGPAGENEG